MVQIQIVVLVPFQNYQHFLHHAINHHHIHKHHLNSQPDRSTLLLVRMDRNLTLKIHCLMKMIRSILPQTVLLSHIPNKCICGSTIQRIRISRKRLHRQRFQNLCTQVLKQLIRTIQSLKLLTQQGVIASQLEIKGVMTTRTN